MPTTVDIRQVKQDLGEDVAKKLQTLYPGMYIYVSNNPTALVFESMAERDRYIFNLSCSGKPYLEISKMLGLSKDRIAKIVAEQIKTI
ncbi:Mor transcription activator family protein [Chakrabartyella piscis]|uniref:Mor transcription activator family protein n=1 Tax=Chakrabartyella piscis TaxID=2918914 RepID=UPI0029583C97|nr:Mor transcription activator family protein [Chakrabartyella piscis]